MRGATMKVADRAGLAREDRAFASGQVELRAEDDGTVTFDGVASTVDTPYTVRDAFGEFEETMKAGAFNKTLKERDDVRLLVNHEGVPLARTKSGTLRLSADPHLRAVAPLDPANPTVQEIRSATHRGDLDQMSVGFRVTRQDWNDDYTERTIRELQLFDVSIVTFPANPNTSASLRSLDEAMRALTEGKRPPAELLSAVRRLESALGVRAVDDMSFDDIRDIVAEAVEEHLGLGDTADVCVYDISDTWVVYCLMAPDDYMMGDMFRLSYTMADDGTVTFSGDPVPVARVTTYQPMMDEAAFAVLQLERARRDFLARHALI